MGKLGFKSHIPKNWNKLWVVMWLTVSPTLIASAFFTPFPLWVAATLLLFLVPEVISISKKDDALPPLTHTIRHFLPNWVAFPIIYFSLGSVGAYWMNVARPFAVGALLGLLGWLTDHFALTYATPDPYPYKNRELRAGTQIRKMPG